MIELSVQGLRAGYGAVEVLHGIDLDVPQGALTALLGPNGAGKSTLLSVVAGRLSGPTAAPTPRSKRFPCSRSGWRNAPGASPVGSSRCWRCPAHC